MKTQVIERMTTDNYQGPTDAIFKATPEVRHQKILHYLLFAGACKRGIAYFRKHRTFESAWYNCPRLPWAIWLSGRVGYYVPFYTSGEGFFGASSSAARNALQLAGYAIQPRWETAVSPEFVHSAIHNPWRDEQTTGKLVAEKWRIYEGRRSKTLAYQRSIIERLINFQYGYVHNFAAIGAELPPKDQPLWMAQEDAIISKAYLSGFNSDTIERRILKALIECNPLWECY